MNDITALAQREKFEAWLEEAEALPWGYLKKRRTYDGFYSEHIYTSLWAAWKAASMALVEALEKAQQDSAVNWEAAASMNVENQELKQRIAELESRSVTVKLPAACADDEYFNDGVFQPMRYERDVERALRAAGIQVIEGEGQ